MRLILLLIFISLTACGQKDSLESVEMYSNALDEHRNLSVYIPENFNENREYNIIDCTDGQFINKEYKNKLDSLIDSKSIEPIIIIGVHSNEKRSEERRVGKECRSRWSQYD